MVAKKKAEAVEAEAVETGTSVRVRRTQTERIIAEFEKAKRVVERAQTRFAKAELEFNAASDAADAAVYSYEFYVAHPLLPDEMRPEGWDDDIEDDEAGDKDEDTEELLVLGGDNS